MIRSLAERARAFLNRPIEQRLDRPSFVPPSAAQQVALRLAYRDLLRRGGELPSFREVGFTAYSQGDEDGILLYLFALLGEETRRCVEIAAGDGIECNTANLILNHRWEGLLVDASARLAERGRAFYAAHRLSYVRPPAFLHETVTPGNVNELIADAGFSGPVDLLSLDVDGHDYWVFDALTACAPRVVVLEFRADLGPELAVTLPAGTEPDVHERFFGASLRAFVELGARKGLRLVGTSAYGYNAFFVQESLGRGVLPTIGVEACVGQREPSPELAALSWHHVRGHTPR
jgi:hypothetical protein